VRRKNDDVEIECSDDIVCLRSIQDFLVYYRALGASC
jgi:hypothetical protein